jgi:chromosome segregation ATPase
VSDLMGKLVQLESENLRLRRNQSERFESLKDEILALRSESAERLRDLHFEICQKRELEKKMNELFANFQDLKKRNSDLSNINRELVERNAVLEGILEGLTPTVKRARL